MNANMSSPFSWGVCAILLAAAGLWIFEMRALWKGFWLYFVDGSAKLERDKHLALSTVALFVIAHCVTYLGKEYFLALWCLIAYPKLLHMVIKTLRAQNIKAEAYFLYRFCGWTVCVAVILMFYRNYVRR